MTEGVVPQLRAVTKALYSTGTVVSVEGSTAVFAIAMGVPMERAERARADVEQLLSAHLGRSVGLRLVEHSDAVDLRHDDPGPGDGPQGGDGDDDAGSIDLDSLEDANDVAESGIERLTRAFPGATVVDDDEVRR